jgi:methionyl-tRNA formyltransferase
VIAPAAPARRHRALFLAALGPIPAHVAWAWQRAGHEIVELWTSERIGRGAWARDRRLGWVAPQWSLSAAIAYGRAPHRPIAAPIDGRRAAQRIAALRPDLVISVHFPHLLPAALLDALTVPAINLHPALLPHYRGPFPLVSMLLDQAADRFGGVTAHAMTVRADAGPIIAALPVPLPPDGNVRRWELSLAAAAARLAVDAIPRFLEGEIAARPQEETPPAAPRSTRDLRLSPADRADRVDWLCRTVASLQPVWIAVGGSDRRIAGIVRHLGRPTGAPPRIGWRHIELDVADARVRLRRRLPWDGQRLKLTTFARRIATHPGWPERGPSIRAMTAAATSDWRPPAG